MNWNSFILVFLLKKGLLGLRREYTRVFDFRISYLLYLYQKNCANQAFDAFLLIKAYQTFTFLPFYMESAQKLEADFCGITLRTQLQFGDFFIIMYW